MPLPLTWIALFAFSASRLPDTRKAKQPGFVAQAFDAVKKGDRRVVARLIVAHHNTKKWLDKVQEPTDGFTLLGLAARLGDVEMVQLLINYGKAKVDAFGCCNGGHTPLFLARDNPEIAEFLLAHGADPLKHKDGPSPLSAAIAEGDDARLTAYLSRVNKKRLNARGKDGLTPLLQAKQRGNQNAVRLLLDHGANPSLKPTRSKSARASR